MHYTGHHIHTLWQQHLEFMTLHALYSVHHTHYIWQLLSSVWCHIHYMWYITQWLYLWYQTLYVHDIFTLYGIIHSVMTAHHCVPSQPLRLIYSKYFCHYTKCSNLWQEVNVSHHSLYMYDTICTTYDITPTLYDITPLYLWRQVHYV